MKRFCILIGVVCFIVLSIHTSSSRAVESWIPPEPSNEMAANGGESLVVSEDLRLVHESPRIWRELKFDNLLAQEEPHIPSAPSTEMVAEMKEEEGADTEEIDKIAEALANPLSYLWLLFTQNDTIWFDGDLMDDLNEDAQVQNRTLLQPVMSVQLTENWKTIFRPVIPINSFSTVDNVDVSTDTVPEITGVDLERETGLGDIVLWTAFSNSYKPPFIWGFGPTIMMDTATDDQLGTGKWSAGPMALAFNITEKWIIGGVFQHWWSFAGDDELTINTSLGPQSVERSDVNLTDFQYVIRHRLSLETNIGMGPNIQYNWETDELSLPVGIGFDTLVKIGKLPVKIGAEAYYYVAQDDEFGPKWQLRLLFIPVLPAPKWSQKPLF